MGRMRLFLSAWVLVAAWPLAAANGPGKEGDKKANPDYAELSRLIRKVVLDQAPKAIEDDSGWGQTIPIPEGMKIGKLRTLVKVGDKLELPHGVWRKIKLWAADPDKDVQIRVRELKPVKLTTYRLVVEADLNLQTWSEVQHWQKGLALVGFIAEAETAVRLNLGCDVAITLNAKKFPPEFKIEPNVTDLQIDLKDFTLKKATLRRLGIGIEGDAAKAAGDQFKGIVQGIIRDAEPAIKERANEAIVKGLKDGKGALSLEKLLKALSAKEKK